MTTNTTTYFFREATALATLVATLPRPRARIWLVGCATGDEAYTLGILAAEAGRAIEIVASDVNERALASAKVARYSKRHARHVPEKLLQRYFEHRGGHYHVRTDLLPPITFVQHDVARDATLTPYAATHWDAVVCRHVLVYLDMSATKRALTTMTKCLAERGPLILAGSEWLGVGTRVGTLAAEVRLAMEPLAPGSNVICYRRRDQAEGRSLHRAVTREPAAAPLKAAGAPARPKGRSTSRLDHVLRDGDAALDRGHLAKARSCFEECLTLAPDDARAHLRYGITCIVEGERRDARRALTTVLALRGESWPALLLLADLAAPDAPDEAKTLYRRALAALRHTPDTPAELAGLHTFWPDRPTLLDMLGQRV